VQYSVILLALHA